MSTNVISIAAHQRETRHDAINSLMTSYIRDLIRYLDMTRMLIEERGIDENHLMFALYLSNIQVTFEQAVELFKKYQRETGLAK